MTDFNSRPSDTYWSAMKALEKLLKEEGSDHVERAAAEVLKGARLKQLQKAGYTLTRGSSCLGRVMGYRSCRHYDYGISSHIPHDIEGRDHVHLLKDKEGRYLYQSQPYGLSWENIQSLVDLCRKHDLRADVDAERSWHFPSRTLSVVIEAVKSKQ